MVQHQSSSSSSESRGSRGHGSSGGHSAAERMKQQTKQAVRDVSSETQSAFRHGQQRAAERLHGLSDAIRHSASHVDRGDGTTAMDKLAGQVADQVESLSGYLRDHELGDIVEGFERWARRNPTIFLGGCFVGGFLISRFIKSSQERRYSQRTSSRREASRSSGPRSSRFGSRGSSSSSSIAGQYGVGSIAGSAPGMTEPSGRAGISDSGGTWEET